MSLRTSLPTTDRNDSRCPASTKATPKLEIRVSAIQCVLQLLVRRSYSIAGGGRGWHSASEPTSMKSSGGKDKLNPLAGRVVQRVFRRGRLLLVSHSARLNLNIYNKLLCSIAQLIDDYFPHWAVDILVQDSLLGALKKLRFRACPCKPKKAGYMFHGFELHGR